MAVNKKGQGNNNQVILEKMKGDDEEQGNDSQEEDGDAGEAESSEDESKWEEDTFEAWSQKHKDEGKCYINFPVDSPSGNMEAAAAVILWKGFEAKCKMKYKYIR